MRLLPVSLALLGGGVVMAAIIPPQQAENASPTRPRTPGQLQETGRIAQAEPTATESVYLKLLEEEGLKQQQQWQQQEERQSSELWHQEAKRQNPVTSHPPLPSTASFSSAAPSGPVTTELAFFTAGGGVYSVSSLSGGIEAVAGKTLVVGGPGALVGGEEVTAAPSGLMVNGAEVEYETVTISASASSVAMSMSMSGGVAGGTVSVSASAGAAASQSSSAGNGGGAMPRATGGVGVAAAFGAVVGVLLL